MIKKRVMVAFIPLAILAYFGYILTHNTTILPRKVVYLDQLSTPLTDQVGDSGNGALVFVGRDRGHCVLCHRINNLNAEFQGNIGPDLSNVGDRLSPSQLRIRIVDYEEVHPGVLMPSYYRTDDLNQVEIDTLGQTILSAQEVEDLIAYLSTLRKIPLKDIPNDDSLVKETP